MILFWQCTGAFVRKYIAEEYFDLAEYPFVKYLVWLSTCEDLITGDTYCGAASDVYQYARYIGLTCDGSSFIHEIGHTLGLGHGGRVNGVSSYPVHRNFKPNYWSVMSYGYGLPYTRTVGGVLQTNYVGFQTLETDNLGRRRARPGHFSREKMININEYSLVEDDGILHNNAGNRIPKTFINIYDPDNAGNIINITIDRVDWSGNAAFGDVTVSDTNSGCSCNDVGGTITCTDAGAVVPNNDCLFSNYKGHNDSDYFDNHLDMSLLAKPLSCPLYKQNNLLGMNDSLMVGYNTVTAERFRNCQNDNYYDLGTRDIQDKNPIICD